MKICAHHHDANTACNIHHCCAHAEQVTGTAYLHIDRGRGASADLTLMKLRAAVLASDALASPSSSKDKEGGGKQGGDAGGSASAAAGPTVEVAPFQKVGVCSGVFFPL